LIQRITLGMLLASLLLLGACESPLGPRDSDDLRRLVVASAEARLADDESAPLADAAPPNASDVAPAYPPEIVRQLDDISDPRKHADHQPDLGDPLDASMEPPVAMSLSQALVAAAQFNLQLELARVIPRIRSQQVVEEDAAFDWISFADASTGHIDRPNPASALNGVPVGSDATVEDNAAFEVGLRKRLRELGGTLEVSTGADYANDSSPGLELAPDPSWTANLAFVIEQPLLQDFGAAVTGARVRLARNARDRDVFAVRERLLQITRDTETAYWELVFSHYALAIREGLLEITRQTRDEIRSRRDVDANPVQLAQAESEVRARQAEVIEAQAAVRQASDQLKRLINSSELPLEREAVVRPTDFPDEMPTSQSLRVALREAIERRPELAQILLELDDAQIRRTVADNRLLPELDLTGEVRHYALDDGFGRTYGRFGEDFFEYRIALQFEQPIGNRGAKAGYQRARLGEQAQRIRYQDTVQSIVLSVKNAMRTMQSSYRVLRISRAGRRAAADNLRALQEREKTGQQLTPEFLLDLKLRTQQRLAQAQIQEVRAVVNYNIARARFFEAIGILHEQRGLSVEAEKDAPTDSNEVTEP